MPRLHPLHSPKGSSFPIKNDGIIFWLTSVDIICLEPQLNGIQCSESCFGLKVSLATSLRRLRALPCLSLPWQAVRLASAGNNTPYCLPLPSKECTRIWFTALVLLPYCTRRASSMHLAIGCAGVALESTHNRIASM